MGVKERILTYLSIYGKENKYRLARALKIGVGEITKALKALEEEGKIEIKGGRAILIKERKTIATKTEKQKKQPKVEEALEEKIEPKEEIMPEQPKEEPEEEKPEEVTEEPAEEEVKETFEAEEKEKRIKGRVKFFNPNKGFGFITGDDGKDYYVHESALKEGVTIEANDRVSFKIVHGDKGPKAEEVEWISQA